MTSQAGAPRGRARRGSPRPPPISNWTRLVWGLTFVVVGIGLVWLTDLLWLDPLVALLLGLNILWTSGKLMRDAYSGLMERVLSRPAGGTEATASQSKWILTLWLCR